MAICTTMLSDSKMLRNPVQHITHNVKFI